jgi:hypothetical protein
LHNPLGNLWLAAAVGLWVVGIVLLVRMSKVEI